MRHKKWRFKKHPYYNYKEFLIKKKNPLVLPPDFTELPQPINSEEEKKKDDEFDLETRNILEKLDSGFFCNLTNY